MIKKVIFCANRPDKGASGGGSGVMFLLRTFLNTNECKHQVEYLYNNEGLKSFIFDVIKQGGHNKGTYYICHEPESAALLSFLGRKYSLVYHQQGPYVEEYISREINPDKLRIFKKKIYERRAFLGADKVYFPSKGAAEVFFSSRYATVKRSEVNVGEPLFNTINPDEELLPVEGIERNQEHITFISVGTFTKLKGQDQVFPFIQKVAQSTDKLIRWITVGDGILKQSIIEGCKSYEAINPRFSHIHYDKLPHGAVLYLDSIADIYIMFHRTSIFDLSTLEAMNKGCAVVLSNVGGNPDFNKEDNCLLIDMNSVGSGLHQFFNSNIDDLKTLNKKAFNDYFSPKCFSDRYVNLINCL